VVKMRILYIGIVDFSHHCLSEVLKNDGNVIGVITSNNINNNSDFSDLTPLAKDYNIPIHYTDNINNKDTVAWIRDKNPDIIFCFGWSQLIQKEVLSIPRMGIIGSHPTLLPENRGRHPLIWSIVLGLDKGGLTFFFMDEGADSGPILSQVSFLINQSDTAYSLYEKIKSIATEQIKEFLPKLINNKYETIEQESNKSLYWRKRNYKDGLIDFRMSKEAIYNLVRALTRPYPGAQVKFKQENITVWEIELIKDIIRQNMEPGRIISTINKKPVVKCYDGLVLLKDYEPTISFKVGDYFQ